MQQFFTNLLLCINKQTNKKRQRLLLSLTGILFIQKMFYISFIFIYLLYATYDIIINIIAGIINIFAPVAGNFIPATVLSIVFLFVFLFVLVFVLFTVLFLLLFLSLSLSFCPLLVLEQVLVQEQALDLLLILLLLLH